MTTYLYQISEDTEEAEMMGGNCSLIIVDAAYFEDAGALSDEHILDDIVATTNDPKMATLLEEVAESMFVSQLDPQDTRDMLNASGFFQERVLFG